MAAGMDLATLGLEIRSDGVVVASQRLRDFSGQARDAETASSRLSASFMQAAKSMAALAAGYASLRTATSFIRQGMDFSSSMESSQIGIASLITSMVKLEDAQGKVLEGAEKYAAAQGMAKELMQEIQKLGLETTATSESLVEGVQSIMGPALQAGMALKDIPKFAVAGAQAMQTLGVPLNQMRTELDALLTGSVNKTQDILAPKLFADVKGDLGEYIRGLKESGTLIDEIMKRLEPFSLAGKDVANTWKGLTSNLAEAVDTLAGMTSAGLLDYLKESVGEFQKLIIAEGEGAVGISQNFQQVQRVLTEIQDTIGEGILSATHSIIDAAKQFNEYLGSSGAAKDFDTLTTAIKLVSAALIGVAGARAIAFGKNTISGAVTAAKGQMDAYRQSLINTAKAEVEAALAAQAKYEAWMLSAQGQRVLMLGQEERNAALARQAQLTDAVSAAQARLNALQTQGIGTGRALWGAIGNGFKNIINFLGGPMNIAVMGAITGFSLLAMKQSEAERAAELHGRALSVLNEITEEAKNQSKDLSDWLGNVAEARRNMAIDDATEAITRLAGSIKLLDFSSATTWLPDFKDRAEELDDMAESVRTGSMSFKDFYQELAETYNKLRDAGEQSSTLGKRIKEALDFAEKGSQAQNTLDKLIPKFNEVAEAMQEMGKKAGVVNDEAAKSINEMAEALEKADKITKSNVSTLEGSLQWLNKRNAATEEGKARSEALARATDLMAMATLNAAVATAEFNAAAANTALLGENITAAMIETARKANDIVVQLKTAQASFEKGMEDPNWGQKATSGRKKSGGGNSGVDEFTKASEKWEELQDKLLQLQGKSDGAAASLKKTLKEIEETGKKAKKSAGEIGTLKQAFIDASDTKTMRELNKELLQLENNTRAVQEIENQEKIDNYSAKLSSIQKLSAAEKEALLGRYQAAVINETERKNLESRLNFYKELANLSGDYGTSLRLQNELLEEQRREWEAAGISAADVEARIQLMKQDLSQNPFDGFSRGARKFGIEYGNIANQVEQFTTQMGSTISSTLSDAFMKGKFSAQDFFNSLIGMAAQAASNYFIGMLFKGIAGAFGGAVPTSGFSGTSANVSSDPSFVGPMIPSGVYHSGGIVGSNYPTDRSLPYYAFSDALRFHRGGGLFRRDEYPAILQSGERVLNRDETKAYQAGLAAGGTPDEAHIGRIIAGIQSQMREDRQRMGSDMPMVNINIENNSNAQVQAGQMQSDGNGGFSMDIIISQVEQGIVGHMRQGKSQLAQYQEKAYGMSRAGVIARGRGRN